MTTYQANNYILFLILFLLLGPGSVIRDSGSEIRIRDLGSRMEKIRIRDKHSGTSTPAVTLAVCELRSKTNRKMWATMRFRIGMGHKCNKNEA
jgi:hypothetical protein